MVRRTIAVVQPVAWRQAIRLYLPLFPTILSISAIFAIERRWRSSYSAALLRLPSSSMRILFSLGETHYFLPSP
jgi:hypothetical protein